MDQLNGFDGVGLGFRGAAMADEGFDGVCQSIHSCRGDDLLRKAFEQGIVEHGHVRDEFGIVDRELLAGLGVHDNGGDSRFAASAGGRGNGNQKMVAMMDF